MLKFKDYLNESFGGITLNRFAVGDVVYFMINREYKKGVVTKIPFYRGDHYSVRTTDNRIDYFNENLLVQYPLKKGDKVFLDSSKRLDAFIRKQNGKIFNIKFVNYGHTFEEPSCTIESLDSKMIINARFSELKPIDEEPDTNKIIPEENKNLKHKVGDVVYFYFNGKYVKGFVTEVPKGGVIYGVKSDIGVDYSVDGNIMLKYPFDVKCKVLYGGEVFEIVKMHHVRSNNGYEFLEPSCDILSATGVRFFDIPISELKLYDGSTPIIQDVSKTNKVESGGDKKKKIGIGSKVLVNDDTSEIQVINRIGEVRKINFDAVGKPVSYLIHFDEDESKNLSSLTIYVWPKYIIDVIGKSEEVVPPKKDDMNNGIKEGDKVFDINDPDKKIGEVVRLWGDGDISVRYAKRSMVVKHSKYFQKFDLGIRPTTTEEEEEEETDDLLGGFGRTPSLKTEDLLKKKYTEFFEIEKVVSREDIDSKINEYEDKLKDENLSKVKKLFYERTLKQIELVDQYFDFLESKIAEGKPVFRSIGKVESKIFSLSKMVRASESKELTKKHGFDRGVIYYWIFEDAVIFKTL